MIRLRPAPHALALAVLVLCLGAALPHPAAAQSWERSYLLQYRNCTQASLLSFGEATERFPGYLQQRPTGCGRTSCSFQYLSTMSPNALLQALYAMIEGQGYRARIGVQGLRYSITCLPGRRRHPVQGEVAPRGFAEFETPCGAVIDAVGDVLFDFDRADIRTDAIPTLVAIAERIRAIKPIAVEITGHTDSRGSDAYNQGLSERRAAAVAGYLAGPLAISGTQLMIRGFGERMPRRPNTLPDGRDDPIGRQANRRVEIFLRTGSGPVCVGPGYADPASFIPFGTPLPSLSRPVPAPPRQIAPRTPRRAEPPVRPLDPSRW
ncbi:MAG: OmpA family protein [Pikeienuella sp.]